MVEKNNLNQFDNISLIKCILFFVIIYLLLKLFSHVFNFNFDSLSFKICLYLPMLIFFIIKLDFSYSDIKKDYNSISHIDFKKILFIVFANILFTAVIFFILKYISYLGFLNFNSFLFGFLNLNNYFDIFSYFLAIVVLSSIVEELLFRGVILNKLVSDYNFDLKLAILISSLLFGLCHNFGSILSAFVFGICMAILYIKSKNILVPILGHFINNLISFILACSGIEFFIVYNNIIILIIVVLFIITNFILFRDIFRELSLLGE